MSPCAWVNRTLRSETATGLSVYADIIKNLLKKINKSIQ